MSTYQSSIPGASGYAGAALLAQKAYDQAKARYAQQRSQTLLNYGFRQGPNGQYSVDPANEYGRYQQMLRGENQQVEGLGRAQAASGWGGSSGYLAAGADELAHAQGGEQLALGQGLQGELSNIAQGEQDAAYNKDAALWQAEQDAADRAINAGQFNPGDYSGLSGDVPYKQAAPKKAVPKKKATPAVHAKGKAKIMKRKAVKAKAKGRRR